MSSPIPFKRDPGALVDAGGPTRCTVCFNLRLLHQTRRPFHCGPQILNLTDLLQRSLRGSAAPDSSSATGIDSRRKAQGKACRMVLQPPEPDGTDDRALFRRSSAEHLRSVKET
jgi:hypothetical protein